MLFYTFTGPSILYFPFAQRSLSSVWPAFCLCFRRMHGIKWYNIRNCCLDSQFTRHIFFGRLCTFNRQNNSFAAFRLLQILINKISDPAKMRTRQSSMFHANSFSIVFLFLSPFVIEWNYAQLFSRMLFSSGNQRHYQALILRFSFSRISIFCSFCGINFWFWIEYLSHWYNLKMEFIYWIQCWTFEFENLGSEFIWAKPKSNSECFGFWISNQNSSQFRHLSAKNVRFASNGSSIDQ